MISGKVYRTRKAGADQLVPQAQLPNCHGRKYRIEKWTAIGVYVAVEWF